MFIKLTVWLVMASGNVSFVAETQGRLYVPGEPESTVSKRCEQLVQQLVGFGYQAEHPEVKQVVYHCEQEIAT